MSETKKKEVVEDVEEEEEDVEEEEEVDQEEEKEEEEEEVDETLTNSDVCSKFQTASEITNRALSLVISRCQAGMQAVELCKMGDDAITEGVAGVFRTGPKAKQIEKGIAFPTCVSINEVAGHFSPLPAESKPIQAGDVVKIDLGCHIDGYIAVAAHTLVVSNEPVTGRAADVTMAAWTAAQAALRMVKPGVKNQAVTDVIAKVAEAYGCQPLEGVLSHQMKRHVIDGNKVIINKSTADQKVEEFEFQPNEVYAIDIVMSTGEGKTKETEARTTVYKRAVETNYMLKMKNSRQFFTEVNNRFPALPFTLRAFEEEKVARMGVVECVSHGLLHPYPVLSEKANELVAQFKFTILLLPGGDAKKITGLELTQNVQSEKKVEDEQVKALLATSVGKKASRKKKKSKSKKAAAAGAAAEEADDE